jgi:hypothetical protein
MTAKVAWSKYLAICESSIVQQAEEYVEHLSVGFLNLIKEQHTVRSTTDLQSMVGCLSVADVCTPTRAEACVLQCCLVRSTDWARAHQVARRRGCVYQ